MIHVYIAGPYSFPDPVLNVRAAIDAAEKLWAVGMAPFIPHLTMLHHLVHPQPIEVWYERDLLWLQKCDVLLRLPGPSIGADREVAEARLAGIAVWLDLDGLIEAHKRDDQAAPERPIPYSEVGA